MTAAVTVRMVIAHSKCKNLFLSEKKRETKEGGQKVPKRSRKIIGRSSAEKRIEAA